MMKRIFENSEAKIEVMAHAMVKDGERFTDHFHLVTIFEGDREAADKLFKQVVARFDNQPIEQWTGQPDRPKRRL